MADYKYENVVDVGFPGHNLKAPVGDTHDGRLLHEAKWWSPFSQPGAGADGGGGRTGAVGDGEGAGVGAGEGTERGGRWDLTSRSTLFRNDPLVQCWLCPRQCVLGESDTGFCGVRRVVGGKLMTLVYGEISSMAVDPVEKKPLYHFLPGSSIFSIGTVGCTMDCIFCQNWRLSRGKPEDSYSKRMDPLSLVHLVKSEGCQSLAFTYNEPTVFGEYVIQAAAMAKEAGLKTVMVTNGYVHERVIDELYADIDAVNVDLKAMSPDFYRRRSRAGIGPVLKALEKLKADGKVWLELTNLLIPGLNDDPDDVDNLCNWVLDHMGPHVPLHFSAFFPTYKATEYQSTPRESIFRARNQALEKGLKFVYTGNVPHAAGGETRCPGCNEVIIARNGWRPELLNGFNKETGICSCGQRLHGLF